MKKDDMERKIIYWLADRGYELPDAYATSLLNMLEEEGMLPPTNSHYEVDPYMTQNHAEYELECREWDEF